MKYFSNLPNIKYGHFGITNSSSSDDILTKNIFRRAKLREDYLKYYTYFEKYQILGDERPDTVSYKLYDTPDYDWMILLINNIINIKREWPMTQSDLNNYLNIKYTAKELSDVKYYKTYEVRDVYGRLIIPANLVVKENFKITYMDDLVERTINPVNPVTYYEHEVALNDKKRNIYILSATNITAFVSEFREVVKYSESSDLIDANTKGTFNPFIKQ